MGSLIVQKYGGMCLATPEKVQAVAGTVAARRRQGDSLIVVVSAMGKTTDDLIKLAYAVSPEPSRRELDMLLTAGERVSMTLLSMALKDRGIDAISLTGSQAGVLTDSSHSNAKIIGVRPTRLKEELARGKVIVLAGFQGVDPTSKEITTLGRGGSDTTAVAIAAACQASACEIIKEVEGLCSADPRLVPEARVYEEVPAAALLDMCFWGAKILHYRSVELAKTMNVPLRLRFALDLKRGTSVKDEVSMFENQQVLAVNSLAAVHHCEVSGISDLESGWARLAAALEPEQLAWPQVLASSLSDGKVRFMYTSDPEHLSALSRAFQATKDIRPHLPPLASVTLTCHGSIATDLGARVLRTLGGANIKAQKLVQSPLSLTIVLQPNDRERAIQVLHEKFVAKAAKG